jgi:excisionase family DNA binding protein
MAAEQLPDWLEDAARSLPIMLSIEQACAELHLSRSTVTRLVSTRALRAVRTAANRAGRVLIPRSEILRYLQARAR